MDKGNFVLFDGVCNLCNGFVQFIIRHDKKKKFKFASLQSTFSQQYLQETNQSTTQFTSFIYLRNGKELKQSRAALYVLKDLQSFISLLFILIIIPPFIRNYVYNIIAKNRYKWFGKKEACMVPNENLKARFLE